MSHKIHATSTPKCDAAIAAAETGYGFEQYRQRLLANDALGASPDGRCPKCRYLKGHDATCPSLTLDQLRDVVTGLIVQCNRLVRDRHKAYDERERWHGKFAIVTAENNALRKANRSLRAELAGLKMQMLAATFEENSPDE